MSPNSPKTPVRPIRVDQDLWDEFGRTTSAGGTDRSAALRAFMAWYVRQPGAKLPTRPRHGNVEAVHVEDAREDSNS